MEGSDVVRLGLILAISTEVEGMKAANKTAEMYNQSLPYNDDNFNIKAEELRNVAQSHPDQL